ncbi:hypothetical protein COEREDRAFT_103100 [Coemansia reversa NRRL 1564]|uniref:Uncharacterized protein n=1 Tax=Coemansia reversa (strain ATCC 12441 / NRRL 1564) TaxID=763665 RepID=A0A2G5B7P5_COERN|nr:hypothetical protein COEREDRAFT_103100 [Coemansia reversa NRRL 1564]|eukprot:PIA15038.1 hypothetical protein COEREDRAFT_103100 [Coemansia reversa NRRL 1564]
MAVLETSTLCTLATASSIQHAHPTARYQNQSIKKWPFFQNARVCVCNAIDVTTQSSRLITIRYPPITS